MNIIEKTIVVVIVVVLVIAGLLHLFEEVLQEVVFQEVVLQEVFHHLTFNIDEMLLIQCDEVMKIFLGIERTDNRKDPWKDLYLHHLVLF